MVGQRQRADAWRRLKDDDDDGWGWGGANAGVFEMRAQDAGGYAGLADVVDVHAWTSTIALAAITA